MGGCEVNYKALSRKTETKREIHGLGSYRIGLLGFVFLCVAVSSGSWDDLCVDHVIYIPHTEGEKSKTLELKKHNTFALCF